MKMGFWGWFGIIVGGLGALIGIYASINPMGIGNLFLQIGPQNIGTYMSVGMPIFFVVVFGAAFGPFVMKGIKNSQYKKRLQQVGQKASAKILSVQDTGITVNMNPYIKVTVQLPNGTTSTFQMLVSRISIPQPGDTMDVLYDPSDPKVILPA